MLPANFGALPQQQHKATRLPASYNVQRDRPPTWQPCHLDVVSNGTKLGGVEGVSAPCYRPGIVGLLVGRPQLENAPLITQARQDAAALVQVLGGGLFSAVSAQITHNTHRNCMYLLQLELPTEGVSNVDDYTWDK